MIRYTRTQHRSASRQVNDHGRVSGTHRPQTPPKGAGSVIAAPTDNSTRKWLPSWIRTIEISAGGGRGD